MRDGWVIKMDKLIDLHMHTIKSDGVLTPAEIVEYAASRGLAAISITDHNTVLGLPEAFYECEKHGIEFIKGIEISAIYNESTVHILGYFIDSHSDSMNKFIKFTERSMIAQYIKWAKFLRINGINISIDQLKYEAKRFNTDSLIDFLIKKRYVTSKEQAYNLYPDLIYLTDREKPTIQEAIKLIKDSHGISFLAHPLRTFRNDSNFIDIISDLVLMGLNGIECYSKYHSDLDAEFLIRVAKDFNLLVSGGSDFHSCDDLYLGEEQDIISSKIPFDVLKEMKHFYNRMLVT